MVGADQLTKHLALTFLSPEDSLPLIPGFFHLTLVRNTGIAFGLFREHHSFLLILITLSLILLVVLSSRIHGAKSGESSFKSSSAISRCALASILGGAVGNWLDRMRFQAVIDFLDFRVWPVFNLADSAITIGVCLYLVTLFRRSSQCHSRPPSCHSRESGNPDPESPRPRG